MADDGGTAESLAGSVRLEPVWRVSFQAPEDETEAILDRLVEIVPLTMGGFDRCSFQSAPGLERYRPREGAPSGSEEALRRRAGIVEVSFQMSRDHAVLQRAIAAIAWAHSYQEPVITVQDVLASRGQGRDHDNPNRWWNREGDWLARDGVIGGDGISELHGGGADGRRDDRDLSADARSLAGPD